MTANELVVYLEDITDSEESPYRQAATMLRQQQAEIDRLNYDMEGFKQNFFVSGFHLQIKMANEQLVKQQAEIEALKLRELTDEEIEEVAKPYCDLQNWVVDKHEFARAILRKASEK